MCSHVGVVATVENSSVTVTSETCHIGVTCDVAIESEVLDHTHFFKNTHERSVFCALVGWHGAIVSKFALVEIQVGDFMSITIENTSKTVGARVVDTDTHKFRIAFEVNVVGHLEIGAFKRQLILGGGRSEKHQICLVLNQVWLCLGAFTLKQGGRSEFDDNSLHNLARRSLKRVGRYRTGEVNVALGVDVHTDALRRCHTVAQHLPLHGIENTGGEVGAHLQHILIVVGKLNRSGSHISGSGLFHTFEAWVSSCLKHPYRVGEAFKRGCCEL